MTETIVDGLEAVEIDCHDGESASARGRHALERVHEGGTVRQACERIMIGLVRQGQLRLDALDEGPAEMARGFAQRQPEQEQHHRAELVGRFGAHQAASDDRGEQQPGRQHHDPRPDRSTRDHADAIGHGEAETDPGAGIVVERERPEGERAQRDAEGAGTQPIAQLPAPDLFERQGAGARIARETDQAERRRGGQRRRDRDIEGIAAEPGQRCAADHRGGADRRDLRQRRIEQIDKFATHARVQIGGSGSRSGDHRRFLKRLRTPRANRTTRA